MQFNTIKNYGLAMLSVLLLVTVLVGVYFNSKSMSMLNTVIRDKVPVQEEIFTINRLLEAATKEFYVFIRSKKIHREDVLLPINSLHRLLQSEPERFPSTRDDREYLYEHSQMLINIFRSLIDNDSFDNPELILSHEQSFIEELLGIDALLETSSGSTAEKDQIRQLLVTAEVAFVRFLEKHESDLKPVFSILDDVEIRLQNLKKIPGTNEGRVEELINELIYTRSALMQYEDTNDFGLNNLLSFTEAEINVLDVWTSMRDAIAVFNAEMRDGINQYQAQMALSSKESSRYLLTFGIISIVFSILVSVVIGRALSSRISQLVAGIRNIAEGDYDHRLNFKGSDDLTFLANSFDAMSLQLKNKERALYEQAHFDSLTGLPNRRKFQSGIEQAISHARRNDEIVVVMFIDLDNFKRVNDSLGHAVGDALLADVANRLTDNIRCSDILSLFREGEHEMDLYRLGGDEFVILLRELNQVRDAARIAERILDILTQPTTLIGYEIQVSASIGISVYPDDAQDVETLVKNADVAMYHAKDNGKNSFQFYSDSANKQAFHQLELENKLRKAIQNDALSLHYQTQIDARTGKVESVEALLRWQDDEFGFIPPDEFIPVAESSNLIIPIGNWVIKQVCMQIRTWQTEHDIDVKVAINLSAIQFNTKDFAKSILDIVEGNGVSPNSIILELTESTIMDNSDKNIRILHQLREMGFELSVDDFGTGYSSLNYLKLFPLNELKIDRSFVDEIPVDGNNKAICDAIIAMGNKLGLRVVAEGVEDKDQQKMLIDSGCDILQGYHLGKPVKAEELDYSSFKKQSDNQEKLVSL